MEIRTISGECENGSLTRMKSEAYYSVLLLFSEASGQSVAWPAFLSRLAGIRVAQVALAELTMFRLRGGGVGGDPWFWN